VAKEPTSVAAWIDRAAGRLESAGLHFGHGTDNARDEAAWLVLHCLGAPLDGSFSDWGRAVSAADAGEISRLLEARCSSGKPLAYLLGSAWFAGLEFEVTADVLVPRSPLAELILDRFQPWVEPDCVERVLDLCTGSGCIAIAAASALPRAQVDASDISAAALQVAGRNVRRHGLADRVTLLRSDLFRSLPPKRYDLIIANPPYVPRDDLPGLPSEYRAEPSLGLAAGDDGLDAVLRILLDAPGFLVQDGVLICEVGESEERLAALLPAVPFLWLEFERGGSGVFVMTRDQLEAASQMVVERLGERDHVT
jgi:ribosomal protein L3 glutamine methyltransferase